MPSIITRPTTTIESPPRQPSSKRPVNVTPDDIPRGFTARNISSEWKMKKMVLGRNAYYDEIIKRIEEIDETKRTRQIV